jgi:adenylate cyclase
MADEPTERRLAAILAADVVGYSRLIGLDEAGTVGALKAIRKELIDASITAHKGRIVKLTGDGMLVEFPSVVNAVACAVDIQRGMRLRNAGIPQHRRIEFRIGVNLGDIIVEDGDIFGDGVNVAARLEGIAEPGGICISASVREHVGNRLSVTFEDAGEQSLKNIARPVRVYRVASIESAAQIAPKGAPLMSAIREKPSIAVLPFSNMSGDPEQEYFADGMTEDLITDLSKVSGLSVIARNSVFTYKGRHADVQEVSRRFNVAAILEGSVRKAGQRVRINAQLVDGADGTHLWADRYDRDLTDIFALQDEITKTIVEQLKVRLLPGEKEAIEAEPTQNLDAYDYYLQGRHFYHLHSVPQLLIAQRLFRKAVELDPLYARAYSGMADCAWALFTNHYEGADPQEIMMASTTALRLDPTLAEAHASHGIALHLSGRQAEALVEFEKAIAIDPNLFEAFTLYAYACRDSGDLEGAARNYRRAAEIAPDDYRTLMLQAAMLRDLGRLSEFETTARTGIERAERALKTHPDIPLPASLGASILAALGERERALEWAARALAIAPDDPLTHYNVACVYALLNETEKALDLIEPWSERVNKVTRNWLANDTDFDSIRDHPRFKALLRPVDQA